MKKANFDYPYNGLERLSGMGQEFKNNRYPLFQIFYKFYNNKKRIYGVVKAYKCCLQVPMRWMEYCYVLGFFFLHLFFKGNLYPFILVLV